MRAAQRRHADLLLNLRLSMLLLRHASLLLNLRLSPLVLLHACKLLLLDYGFTVLGWRRIQLKTDIRNTRSIASFYMQGRQVDRAAIKTRLQAAR